MADTGEEGPGPRGRDGAVQALGVSPREAIGEGRGSVGQGGEQGDVTVVRPSCPAAYHYQPEDLAEPPAFTCTTLYVAGGLYGNPYALDAIQARAGAEPSPPEIVFNGDFHYLDADPAVFRTVGERVRACHAT